VIAIFFLSINGYEGLRNGLTVGRLETDRQRKSRRARILPDFFALITSRMAKIRRLNKDSLEKYRFRFRLLADISQGGLQT